MAPKRKVKTLNKAAAHCTSFLHVLSSDFLNKAQKKKILASLDKKQLNNIQRIIQELLYVDHGIQLDKPARRYVKKYINQLEQFANKKTGYNTKKHLLKQTGGFLGLIKAALPIIGSLAGPLVAALVPKKK